MEMDFGAPVEIDKAAKTSNKQTSNGEQMVADIQSPQSEESEVVEQVKAPDENMSQEEEGPEGVSIGECGAMSQEEGTSSSTAAKDVVIKMLDEMDIRVDKLRSDAMTLENEKDEIWASLDTIKNAQMIYQLDGIDMDEVTRYIDRLKRRCGTVEVVIHTERSKAQTESLNKVNNMIDSLIRDLKQDALRTRRRCFAYINACSEQVSTSIPEIDSTFENAVLGCSIEDQKRIKKRLTGLYSYFKSTTNQSFVVMEEDEEEEIIFSGAIERSLQKE